jgi:hypothetical protein
MTAAGTSRPSGPFLGQPELSPPCSGEGPPASASVTRAAAQHSPSKPDPEPAPDGQVKPPGNPAPAPRCPAVTA